MRAGAKPLVLASLLLAALLAGCSSTPTPATESLTVTLPAVRFDTEMGSFTAILYKDQAPRTVDLILDLVNSSYFQSRGFTRVVPGHVIQETDVAGGTVDDPRTVPLEIAPELHFAAGALGIARGPSVNSGGPEFFVMDFGTSHLDGNYTVWGQVVRGLNVVHNIARVPSLAAQQVPSSVPLLGGTLLGTTDRMATPPVMITGAQTTTVTMTKAEWAHYPLQVAHNVRHGDVRDSLEWPADLRVGAASDLTWYVRPYNGTQVYVEPVTVVADGASLGTLPDGDAAGAYHFTWTPTHAGTQTLELRAHGQTVGTLVAKVGA